MTTTIREFKMEVTERALLKDKATSQSIGTSTSSGQTSFTIQIPTSPDQVQTARSLSVERGPVRKK